MDLCQRNFSDKYHKFNMYDLLREGPEILLSILIISDIIH